MDVTVAKDQVKSASYFRLESEMLNPVRGSCSTIAVDPNAQRDWLLAAQAVIAETELCFVQMDYLSFDFVES